MAGIATGSCKMTVTINAGLIHSNRGINKGENLIWEGARKSFNNSVLGFKFDINLKDRTSFKMSKAGAYTIASTANDSHFCSHNEQQDGRVSIQNIDDDTSQGTTTIFNNSEMDVFRISEKEATLGIGSSKSLTDFASRGLESAINESSKWLVVILFSALLIWKHDAEVMWALVGAVMNAQLSTTLKRLLNHQRPTSTSRSDPGMPSSHAQSIFYFVMLAMYMSVQHLGVTTVSLTTGSVIFACGSYLTWLRVSEGLHTVSQVLVGAILGSAFSIAWLWLWQTFVLKATISLLWVRILLFLASTTSGLLFILYASRQWLKDDR